MFFLYQEYVEPLILIIFFFAFKTDLQKWYFKNVSLSNFILLAYFAFYFPFIFCCCRITSERWSVLIAIPKADSGNWFWYSTNTLCMFWITSGTLLILDDSWTNVESCIPINLFFLLKRFTFLLLWMKCDCGALHYGWSDKKQISSIYIVPQRI